MHAEVLAAPAVRPAFKRRGFPRAWRSLRATPMALTGALIVAGVVAVAMLAPVVTPADPNDQSLRARVQEPGWTDEAGSRYLLGTDPLGRDLLSRLIYGARTSLLVAGASVLIAGCVGVLLGLVAGYYGGWLDDAIGRLMDVQLAVPYMLLAIVVVMVVGAGLWTTVGVLAVGGWAVFARLARAEALALRSRDYVTAARSMGQHDARILLRQILPNALNPVIVIATVEVANMMLFEAGLSFLGLGVRPPAISWGSMLSDGRDYLTSAWWVATFPGLAITVTVFGINQLGDWLRDVLDPRTRGR
jgi:peptide/nickel transport system permease protein